MARPRKPTNILILKGAFKKDPKRKRPPGPQGIGEIGNPPGRLIKEAKTAWRDVVKATPEGVLTATDRISLEFLSELMAAQRVAPLKPSYFAQMRSLMVAFGLDPAARAKIGVGSPAKKEDPFDEFRN